MSSRAAEQKAATAAGTAEDLQSSAPIGEHGPIEDELASLREAIEELRGRQGASEDQLGALAEEMTSMRGFREHTETELSKLRIDVSALASIIDEFAGLPAELRAQLEPELAAVREQLQLQVAQVGAGDPVIEQANSSDACDERQAAPETSEAEEATADGSLAEQGLQPPDGAEPFVAQSFELADECPSWLAAAIRHIAQKRDPGLVAELIVELLPVHALLVDEPLAYALKIDEVGTVTIHAACGAATVVRADAAPDVPVDFTLEGPAAAFAPLAGGAGRRFSGLRVRGSRRKARRLLKACRPPLALRTFADAGVALWPGLLLLALADTVEPMWTIGEDFLVAFAITGHPGSVVYVGVNDGAPMSVSATIGSDQGQPTMVYASERALLAMAAGIQCPPDEEIVCLGDAEQVKRLFRWFARGQGAAGLS